MVQQVLFIQGGGAEDDYVADSPLVTSLQQALGDAYAVQYPRLPAEPTPDFGRLQQIGNALSVLPSGSMVVAHSLGASMLLKYLAQRSKPHPFAGLFLLATPYWQGNEDWKEALKLPADFASRLPATVPVFLYHCHDDEQVPIAHLDLYAQQLPQAHVRHLPSGGHQFTHGLSLVARDIKLL
ncbi:alpha/beta hydrolase [Microvirga sp. STR05]|uniref:Alpha/beta hydrolase n=1 Tax=Hymenobacter duratus TaxID=2771356 RepID=A0ABR8JKA2_9BACT|nr:alpha/beta hydrolase [Hymenobacter duratus]MBD2717270.1 alpha/beta hydrolase [Hymenobacter duratus]MBR7952190.1 alpha/beta hydrolase [Microvirga sp. STR05]